MRERKCIDELSSHYNLVTVEVATNSTKLIAVNTLCICPIDRLETIN